MNYEWRFCNECHQRIFQDEVIGDTIDMVDSNIYCTDCANEIKQNKIIKTEMENKLL